MNVFTITGRLASDPARRDTPRGVVCEFRVAVDGRPRLWISIEAWGRLAGTAHQHLQRGRHVAVSGSLMCDQYVNRAGEQATRWFCRADRISYLDAPAAVVEESRVAS